MYTERPSFILHTHYFFLIRNKYTYIKLLKSFLMAQFNGKN